MLFPSVAIKTHTCNGFLWILFGVSSKHCRQETIVVSEPDTVPTGSYWSAWMDKNESWVGFQHIFKQPYIMYTCTKISTATNGLKTGPQPERSPKSKAARRKSGMVLPCKLSIQDVWQIIMWKPSAFGGTFPAWKSPDFFTRTYGRIWLLIKISSNIQQLIIPTMQQSATAVQNMLADQLRVTATPRTFEESSHKFMCGSNMGFIVYCDPDPLDLPNAKKDLSVFNILSHEITSTNSQHIWEMVSNHIGGLQIPTKTLNHVQTTTMMPCVPDISSQNG